MKKYEIRQMTDDELRKRIIEEENNLVDLRFALATKQLTNTAKIKLTRKDIARMKTVLRERELGLERKADSAKKEEK
jgi:large subunit ribosomal protein L29